MPPASCAGAAAALAAACTAVAAFAAAAASCASASDVAAGRSVEQQESAEAEWVEPQGSEAVASGAAVAVEAADLGGASLDVVLVAWCDYRRCPPPLLLEIGKEE